MSGGTNLAFTNIVTGSCLSYVRRRGGDEAVHRVIQVAGETRPVRDLEDPNSWSSYWQVMAVFEAAGSVLAEPEIGLRAGEEVWFRYGGSDSAGVLRSAETISQALEMYPQVHAKNSAVSSARLLAVSDGHTELAIEDRPGVVRRSFVCQFETGLLSQLPVLLGMDRGLVKETSCVLRGDPHCTFTLAWNTDTGEPMGLAEQVELLQAQLGALTARFESLEAVSEELVSTTDVDSLLAAITKRAGLAALAPQFLLVVRLPKESTLRYHQVGFTEAEARILAEQTFAGTTEELGKSRLTVDVGTARCYFGRLVACYPDGYRFFPHEKALLNAYAGHVAAVLESATALSEARERNDTLSALLGLGTALSEVGSVEEVADRLAQAVPDVIDCDEASVLLWDPGDAVLSRMGFTSRHGGDLPVFSRAPAAIRDRRLARRMLDTPGPIVVPENTGDPILGGILSVAGLRSAMIVPVVARHEFLGIVAVGSLGRDIMPDEGMRERMAGVAALTATALDNARLLAEARYRAHHDPVTDLPNAKLFEDRVVFALSLARRSGSPLGLLSIDIDQFNSVNETHGHSLGDELLRAIGERLVCVVREDDTVARLGGDEFGILLQQVRDSTDAEIVARKVVAALGMPFVVRGHRVSVGASVGITLFPKELDSYQTVIHRADNALYEAKAAGRGCYRIHKSDLAGSTGE